MSNDFFKACAFADEEGNTSWVNYGGVFFDDGQDYEWIEDTHGLTQEQAKELARILNRRFSHTSFWYLYIPAINKTIQDFINTLKEEGV